jgi:hypothetical protein
MSTRAPFQFGLSSLLLITTLVAVIMSVSVMVPGIGIFLAIVSVPALVRTYILIRRQRDEGKSASNRDKAVLFLLCLGIAALIALAVGVAFFMTCLGGFAIGSNHSLDTGFAVGGTVGTCCAVPLSIYLLWIWFRYPRKKRERAGTDPALRDWLEDINKPDKVPDEDREESRASPSEPPPDASP